MNFFSWAYLSTSGKYPPNRPFCERYRLNILKNKDILIFQNAASFIIFHCSIFPEKTCYKISEHKKHVWAFNIHALVTKNILNETYWRILLPFGLKTKQ